MSSQDRGQASRPTRDESADHEDPQTDRGRSVADAGDLDADVDAILDEIDEVLEVNAEDFVKSFVQKGGQ